MRGRTITIGVGLAPHVAWNPAVGVIWDIATSSGLYSWSNDRLTVTRPSGTGDQLARATLARTVGSGSFYYEVTPTFGAGNGSIGFTDSTQATNDWVGDSPHSAGIYSGDGHVYGNGGSSLATLTTLVSGVPIGVYLDSAGKLYFRNNAGWMGGADPSAGTGGVDVSAILTSAIPAVSCNNSTTSFAANFGLQTFAYAIPTGGVAWDPAAVSGSVTTTVTITAASMAYVGQAVTTNAIKDVAVTFGSLVYTGQADKTTASHAVVAGSMIYAGQPVKTSALHAIVAGAMQYLGQAITLNATTVKPITNSTMAYAPQTVIVNANLPAVVWTGGMTLKLNERQKDNP